MKIVFTPISIIAGLLAGIAGKKVFERLWGLRPGRSRHPPDLRQGNGFLASSRATWLAARSARISKSNPARSGPKLRISAFQSSILPVTPVQRPSSSTTRLSGE
jgi:hypothetical protein